MNKCIVLLDLDGTIGDTAPGIKLSVEYALNSINFRKLTDQELNEFIGPPIFDAMLAAGVDRSFIDKAISQYRTSYSSPTFPDSSGVLTAGMFECTPFSGVEKMLQELSSHPNWTIITGTSKPERWAREILTKFDFIKYLTPIHHQNVEATGEEKDHAPLSVHHGQRFEKRVETQENDGVFGASMDKHRAKKSLVLKYALENVGFDPAVDKAILVGDRHHDVDGAKEIGIPVVGCLWGYAVEGEIENADYLIKTPSELNNVLEKFFEQGV